MEELSSSKSAQLEDVTNGIRTSLQSVDHQESAQQNRLQLHKDSALTAVTNFIQQIRPDVPTGEPFCVVVFRVAIEQYCPAPSWILDQGCGSVHFAKSCFS